MRRAHDAFPPECFEPAREILEQAPAETRDHPSPEFAERVRFIRPGIEHARLATKLTAVYDGRETVRPERIEEAGQALQDPVSFRKDHEHTFFSDLLHVTSFWERPRMNLDNLLEN